MIKKGDILLSVVIVISAMFLLAGMLFVKKDGRLVKITVDGEVFGEYQLYENQTVEVKTEKGSNTVHIKDGRVTVIKADCPDLYCVNHIAINQTGETIVCLPHRVIVEVVE